MPIKHTDFIVKGMYRDLSEHAFNPEFAYENQNLRITAEPNTSSEHTGDMYALTNERGNKYVSINGLNETGHNEFGKNGNMKGCPIGQCLINNQWVVFTTELPEEIFIEGEEKEIEDFPIEETQINNLKVDTLDRIYRLWFNNDVLTGELLYEGHLNFDYNSPIETLPSYENEEIQKVYWTDGLNQPRFINIVENEEKRNKWNDTSFDFVKKMNLTASVKIIPNETGGVFPAGKVQYYFTYSELFGQETNIFASTELYDIKFPQRGASPEEQTSQSFTIDITNIEQDFDYINIYSVIRTSIDNIPICKRIASLPITGENLSYTDTNVDGELIEPQSLFYKGGEEICAYTISQKDNTLFLGNYTLKRSYIPRTIRNSFKNFAQNNFKFTNGKDIYGSDLSRWLEKDKTLYDILGGGDHYDYVGLGITDNQDKFRAISPLYKDNEYIDSIENKVYFRKSNTYRIGLQFQHYSGKWSEAIWLGDYECDKGIEKIINNEPLFVVPLGYLKITNEIKHTLNNLISLGYRKVRPLVVYPKISERKVLFQGILSTTLYETSNTNKIYPDYFFRFFNFNYQNPDGEYNNITSPYRYTYSKYCLFNPNSAADWVRNEFTANVPYSVNNFIELSKNIYSIYSPDIEFNDSYKTLNYNNIKLNIVDYVNSFYSKPQFEILTSSISKPKIGHRGWHDNGRYLPFQYMMLGVGTPNWGGTNYEILSEEKKYDNPDSPDNPYDEVINVGRYYGYGYNDWSYNWDAYSSFVKSTKDSPDIQVSANIQPNRLMGFTTPSRISNHHYVGGFIWNDTLQNISMEKSELLGDVPSRSGGFMQYYFNYLFPVYIWQSSGSICYDMSENPASTLKSNKTLNYLDFYRDYTNNQDNIINIKNATLCYGDSLNKINDNVFCSNQVNTFLSFKEDYCVFLTKSPTGNETATKLGDTDRYNFSTDGLGLKILYKKDYSNKFAVPFDPVTDGRDEFKWHNISDEYNSKYISFSYKSTDNLMIELDDNDINELNINALSYIPIVNVLQTVDNNSMFGGVTEADIQNNSFLVCGESVNFVEEYIENGYEKYRPINSLELIWKKGDTYMQYYECLKTYPRTLEDENCVTEIAKVLIESYCNLNGRYDRNIGNPNFGTLPSNWNFRNNIYDQKDNFMVYHGLDLSQNSINNFPNSFTWTLTKWAGDEVDKWTQITLANTMDVDGSKGNITKILKFQDQLLCFQPNQLSQILYNEREQIATGSGVPIELSNSGKVNGIRPVTSIAGCNNKWSITKSEKGLYWIDDVNKQIVAFNGQIMNLSDTLGFHSWINDMSTLYKWNPVDFNSFVSYYDPYNENVMFIYNNNVLSYNEQTNCFDTFLPYKNVPYYMAFNKSGFMLSNRDVNGRFGDYKVWEMFKGNYNYFFVHDNCVYTKEFPDIVELKGRYDKNSNPTNYGYEPYWTILLANPDMPYDKIFNNLDMRTDMWNKNNELLEETFSHLEVWNEFQWNKSQLVRNVDIPKVHLPAQHSILKKKFRVWYANIPRDIKQSNPKLRYYNRDRMRNTWLYIKLSKELINNDNLIEYPYISDNKHIIHHIGVSYFI